MRTTIFYFTGTGNSMMVARDLAHELGDARIVSIARATREQDPEARDECVGFVFPLYYQGVPAIVQDFVKKLHLGDAKYVFGIVTNDGGDAMSHLAGLLEKKGVLLSAGFQISLPYNYIINNFGLDVTGDPWREEQFRQEKIKVKEIAGIIKARKQIGLEKKTPLKWKLFANLPILAYARKSSTLGKSAKNFRTDGHCNGCSRCRMICPVNNIEMVNGRPVWNDRCQQCLACIHWCTNGAIQYLNRTSDKKRYTNPYITFKDMIDSTTGVKNESDSN